MPKQLIILVVIAGLLAACSQEQEQKTSDKHSEREKAVVTEAITEALTPVPERERQGTEAVGETVDGPAGSADSYLKVLDISERNRDGKNGIAVTFSRPVDSSVDIQPYFSVSLDDGSQVDGAWELSDNRKLAWFMSSQPNTRYYVQVNPGLRADNSSQLLAAFSETLSTRKLRASVNFDSDGLILPLGYASGLPVVSVNVPQVDVDFFRIDEKNISEFIRLTRNRSRSNWYTRNLRHQGKLVYTGRFELNTPDNTRVKRDLDIQNIDALTEPGLYLAIMRGAGDYDELRITWFSVSDIGLHLRDYKNQLDVHAASLKSGKPLAGISLQLLDSENRVLQQNKTTPEGLASFSGTYASAEVLVAQYKNQYTLLDLKKPALDLSDFDLGKRPQLPNEFFVYSPRDLYRPGEVVSFSGLLRDYDGRLQQSPVLNAEIRNATGASVKRFRWQAQKLGYYQYQWQLPEAAPTGQWQLVVKGTMGKAVTYDFHVEEFLPERMKLSFIGDGEISQVNSSRQTISVDVLGEYLYGAPAAGNKFSTLLQVQHWRSPIEKLKNYQFGDLRDTAFTRQQNLDDIFLDDEGKAQLTVASLWQEVKSPLEVKIVGSLYESGGRPVTRAHSVLVWPQEKIPGIRPAFGDTNPKPGTSAGFDIVLADSAGALHQKDSMQATLIREDRQYFWEYNSHRGWSWNFSEKEFPVSNESFAVREAGPVTLTFPVEWGRYRLEVSDPDSGVTTSVQFFAGHDWYYDWKNADTAAAARPDKINLALDKAAYNAGDTAELKILPPAAGEVLVLVEGDKPLFSKKLSVSETGTSLKIPISKEWDTHNLYVTAMLVQPAGVEMKQTPKRAMGLIHLPLNRKARKLELSLGASENNLPGSTLNTQIQINSQAAQPEQAIVTLAAVDVGVLSITDFETPDAFEHFFGQRRYAVEARDVFADVIEVNQHDKARQRFGGDADLVRGGQRPQSDVQIVSLFSGPVELDKNGRALVPFELPDFNGRLRLMALAFGDDTFGKAEKEVTVAAEIIAEIAMPRFLAYGDKSTLALDLQNMTEQPVTLEISVSAGKPLMMEAKTQSIALQPKQKTTLRFPVEAAGFEGLGKITVVIKSDEITDFSRSWALGVRPAYPAVTESIQQIVGAGKSFEIDEEDISGIILETLQTVVSVSPVVDLQIGEQLKHLLAYPYGCLEQTSSRGIPLSIVTEAQQKAFNIEPMADEQRRVLLQKAVDRVMSFQRGNGSFGTWSSDSPEAHWLTVYATDFLLKAKDAGADVPGKPLQSALKRLEKYLNMSNTFVRQRWSTQPKHYAFATRAYAALVLSRLQRAPLGALRNMYAREFGNAKSGFPQLQLGLALLKMGDRVNGREAIGKALKNSPSEYRYWGDYGSEIRDLGMMIHLLAGEKDFHNQMLNLSLQLRDAVVERRWLSTQERIALLLAGTALEQNLNTPWKGKWQLGNNEQGNISQTRAWSKTITGTSLESGFRFNSENDSPLYASALLNAYGAEPPQAVSEGVEIERFWYTASGEPVVLDEVKTGELYIGHIVVNSNQRINDALLVNLLPAGFELENQNFDNATRIDAIKVGEKTLKDLVSDTELVHQEFRDDRYVAAFEHNNYRNSHMVFAVRAVTPGTYTMPPPMVEDMYRPEIRAIGESVKQIRVVE